MIMHSAYDSPTFNWMNHSKHQPHILSVSNGSTILNGKMYAAISVCPDRIPKMAKISGEMKGQAW